MRHMPVNTAVLCEMHFSAFQQVKLVMAGLILTTNMATESMKDVFTGVSVKGVRAGPAGKIHNSLQSQGWFMETLQM